MVTEVNGKLFISADDLREKCWELTEQVVKSGFRPDYLIAVWRGGSVVGMYLHAAFNRLGWEMDHFPLKAYSYTGIRTRGDVQLEAFDYVEKRIKEKGYRKILLVDDVFETGHTMHEIKEKLGGREVRIATPYWKEDANETPVKPDYFVQNMSKKTWIVFPHEFEGLTEEEIVYKGQSIAERLNRLKSFIQP